MKVCIDGVIKEIEDTTEVVTPETEPTLEERLAAVEAALLEQMLGGLKNV